jgi:hypothetical protein
VEDRPEHLTLREAGVDWGLRRPANLLIAWKQIGCRYDEPMIGTWALICRRPAFTLAVLAFAFATVGCSAAAPSVSSRPSAVAATGSAATAGASGSGTFAVDDAGLRLVATLDRVEVEPGGTITVKLALTNGRSTPVAFLEPCGRDAMTVQLPTPMEPAGETWTGTKGAFKDYALKESQGTPMESSIRNPPPTTAAAMPCHASTDPELAGVGGATLSPGDTYETELAWTASLVRGLPSTAGSMPFSITVQHDLQAAGNGMYQTKTLTIEGTIDVLPGGPNPVSAGQALDAALGDKKLATWLAKHPRKTWVNTNLFLQPGAIGVKELPSVPYWDVELFAEPRSWVFVYVDASTAKVLRHTVCDVPCDR